MLIHWVALTSLNGGPVGQLVAGRGCSPTAGNSRADPVDWGDAARCDCAARSSSSGTRPHGSGHPPPKPAPARSAPSATELDLRREGISTILWANGFRPASDWIDLPIFDAIGFPRAKRGIAEVPGLGFIGLPRLHTRRSSLLLGVGADAEYVSAAIAAQVA